MKIFHTVLILSIFFLTLPVSKLIAAPRTALVIGNGAYKSAPLKNPTNDASDIANVLTDQGFDVILKLNASQREMKEAVRTFGKKLRQDGGVGLFYYAGHGLQLNNRNYLVSIGSVIESEGDVEFEALDAALILNKMADAGNDLNIVILDACRNNPFARSFRSVSSGLARMDAPKGSIIAYATSPGGVAADGFGRNGIYTKHLIRNIQNPQLTIEQVFKNVRVAVVGETLNKQVPWESSSLMGTFYFDTHQTGKTEQKRMQQPVPITQPKDNSYELLFWESIKNSKSIKMYEAYLSQFPNGAFVQLAQLNILQLKEKPAPVKKVEPVQRKADVIASIEPEKKPPKKDPNIIAEEGQYIKYKNGIIYDKKTNLDWLIGPDRPTDGNRANYWIWGLDLDGGGWRIPSKKELKSLYKSGRDKRNISNLFMTRGWIIHSKGSRGKDFVKGFDFKMGRSYAASVYNADGGSSGGGAARHHVWTISRAFAVRPHR